MQPYEGNQQVRSVDCQYTFIKMEDSLSPCMGMYMYHD